VNVNMKDQIVLAAKSLVLLNEQSVLYHLAFTSPSLVNFCHVVVSIA